MRISELTSQAPPPTSERNRQFVNDVIEESPLLMALDNFDLGATEDKYRVADGGQTLASRAAGGTYTPGDLTPGALQSANLKFHGFILDYDESYEKDHDLGIGIDMDAWLRAELSERAIDTGEELEKLIIAGDGVGDNIKGLATILDGATNVPGFSITMVINAITGTSQTNSFDLTTSTNYDLFLEQLEKWKAEVKGPDTILCNRKMGGRLATIAREKNSWGQGFDQFGNPVEMINGMAILRIDDNVITNTEPDDAATPNNNTTSIYLFRNRVGYWTIRSNSGLATWDVGELEGKQSRRWKFEKRGFNEIKRKHGIRRVRNIKV